jgi:hypothetical protein
VYESSKQESPYTKGIRACSKLIDAIFIDKSKGKYKPSRRIDCIHKKGRHFMYINSDEYEITRELFIRVKNIGK